MLLNHGAWCPFCTGQLRAFQRAVPKLEEAGIRVVLLSVDDEETVRNLVAENHLEFPVGHGADAVRKVGKRFSRSAVRGTRRRSALENLW